MTNQEIKSRIITTVKACVRPVNPSVIMQKNGWYKDDMDNICKRFGVKGFIEVLNLFPELKVSKNENGTPSVCLAVAAKPSLMQSATNASTNTAVKPVEKTTQNSRSAQIKMILEYLNQSLYGKEEAVRLVLLSAVANESIFFMGPPGTAKSMISRRIAAAFSDFYDKDGNFNIDNGGYFEYLMNEFSTPDEICGPVDLSALNETPSRYERQTNRYLPSAKVAFLDEIWKSGPAILNTLLTIINEKKFHNGHKVEKVPLVSLTAASNELPEKDRGLEALWDRFILRVFVNPVETEEDFYKVIDDGNNELKATAEQAAAFLKISDVESWQTEINKVELSNEAKNMITAIRQELARLNEDENHKDGEAYYISDRRWKKIVHILKTSAFLNGRNAVDLMDCSLIQYAIWNTDMQHEEVGGIIEKILKQNGITDDGSSLKDISEQIDEFEDLVNEKWFDHIVVKAVAEKPAKEITKIIDNEECYECIRDGTNTIWYVGVNRIDTYGYAHYVYYSNGEYYGRYDFSKEDNKIHCGNNYTINMTKAVPAVAAKDYFEPKLFEPVAKKAKQGAFDQEHYTPLLNQVNLEIANLQKFRDDSAEPFENNMFAEQKFCNLLLEKIDDSILEFKKQKDELEKQHSRYASDSNVKSDFSIGDKILADGSTKSSKEKAVKEEIIAVVCMLGNDQKTAYGLSKEGWENISFEEAKKRAANYRKTEADNLYNSAWNLPTIEQWKKIYENRKEIKNLEYPFKGRYWSSSVTGSGAVYCFDFDEGKEDHTTPDHSYNVYLIRKLAL